MTHPRDGANEQSFRKGSPPSSNSHYFGSHLVPQTSSYVFSPALSYFTLPHLLCFQIPKAWHHLYGLGWGGGLAPSCSNLILLKVQSKLLSRLNVISYSITICKQDLNIFPSLKDETSDQCLIRPPVNESNCVHSVIWNPCDKEIIYNRLLSIVHIAIDPSKQCKYITTTYL